MTQQTDLEQEKASRPAAGAPAPPETVDAAPRQEEMGKTAAQVTRPDFHLNVPFYIDPTTDVDLIDRIFESVARHRWSINLQIHIDPGSSEELLHQIAASMERRFYGDKP